MPHDWGVTVHAHVSTEQVIEIRDMLRSGEMKIEFDLDVPITPEIESWRRELTEQMLAAYEREVVRRQS